MSAPLRKAAASKPATGRPARARSRAATPKRTARQRPAATSTDIVANSNGLVRHHHDAEEAASAAAVGAALIGPFLLAGAIGLRVLRHLTRRGH